MTTSLGNFEELVLLAVVNITNRNAQAYVGNIQFLLQIESGNIIERSAIDTTLRRLQEKDCVTSETGKRNRLQGPPPRVYNITEIGRELLAEAERVRTNVRNAFHEVKV